MTLNYNSRSDVMVITADLLKKFSFGPIFYIFGRYGVYIDIELSSVSFVNVMTDLWVKSFSGNLFL